ncbi:26S Proteasome core subunit-alpha-3 [Enterocytozoon bieneusi H348]|nr:26S Proteasome core subunit-alpha-3 [Enterocytozoon bieneusi H348]|eukprot:XP_002649647.1 26S Proteasome core subunit-alpha-3 [Enterocytozoon bieneusi H348]
MRLLDIGNKYNENGKNLQIEYAQKLLSKASGCIGIKNSKGAVLFSLKPIITNLKIYNFDENIIKINENCYITGTGLDPDKIFIIEQLKDIAKDYKKNLGEDITGEYLKVCLNNLIIQFNSLMNARVLGAEFIIMKKEHNDYLIYLVKNTGSILRYKGAVIGSIERRAKTELEKIDLEQFSLEEMIEAGIRTFYKCFDPLVDKEFTLEIGIIGDETNGAYYKLQPQEMEKYISKYCDLTVDDN